MKNAPAAREDAAAIITEIAAHLFHDSVQGIVCTGAGGDILAANPAAERILGLSAIELLARPVHDARWNFVDAAGEPLTADEQPAPRALRTGLPVSAVVGVARPTGELRWLRVEATPVFRDGSTPALVYSVLHDITAERRSETGACSSTVGMARDVAEQRHAAQRHRRQREFLQAIIDAAPTLIATKDGLGRYTLVNRAFADLYGMTVDEVTGTSDYALVDPSTAAAWRTTDEHVLRDGAVVVLPEERVQHVASGQQRWLQTVKLPLDVAGEPNRQVLAIAMDITERKAAEQAFLDSEQRFRNIVEQSLAGIYILDGERFEYVNPRFAEIFGYEPADLIGRMRVGEIVDEADRQIVRHAIRERMSGAVEARRYRWRGRRRDGSLIHVEVHGRRVEQNGSTRIIGVLLDVTAEEQVEQRLRAQERRFRSLTENLGDVISVLGPTGAMLYVTPSVERVLGYTVEDSLRTPLTAILHPDDHSVLLGAIQADLAAPGNGSTLSLRLRHRNGGWRTIESSSRNLLHDPAVGGIVVASRDITDRVALEEQLRQVLKMEAIGQLAGGIAHDFNNILTAVQGYAEVLLGEMPAGDPRRDYVEEISRAGKRAASLTGQLLAFGRKQVLRPRTFDLSRLVLGMEPMLRRLIGEDVALDVSATGYCPVLADPTQVEQVVLNLVVNARDALPCGGPLRVRVSCVAGGDAAASRADAGCDEVLLQIEDEGVGMDEETSARIFDPFFTTKPPGQGTGLGLSTVHGIVSQSNGRIHVTSRPGAGSTFSVYLPRARAEAHARPATPAPAPSGGHERIILVEDDDTVRALACGALRQAGYSVTAASDGFDALSQVRANRAAFDLVVTDVVMPRMNGRELTDALTAEGIHLPVLYMSGYTEDQVVRRGVASASEYMLEKPFRMADLVGRVRQVLDRR